MKKYYATFLYVGDSEHERYNVSLPLQALMSVFCRRHRYYRLAG